MKEKFGQKKASMYDVRRNDAKVTKNNMIPWEKYLFLNFRSKSVAFQPLILRIINAILPVKTSIDNMFIKLELVNTCSLPQFDEKTADIEKSINKPKAVAWIITYSMFADATVSRSFILFKGK
jgi:hypothetical protein